MDADLRDGRCRVVGTKQLLKKLAADGISVLYIASDAQEHIKDKLLPLAKENRVPIVEIETMEMLGEMCGIAVGSAAAGLLKEAV
ncbi:MAG: ribosomal L7Ae/L30e/S12e/Gadd45 family protein [Candidatus Spyradocola sp.]|jgi:large subunit ribosomal protein L7A